MTSIATALNRSYTVHLLRQTTVPIVLTLLGPLLPKDISNARARWRTRACPDCRVPACPACPAISGTGDAQSLTISGEDTTAHGIAGPTAATRQELEFLAEVARLVGSARTWDELMGTIVDRATAAAQAEVCSLYLMDRDGTGVTLAATNGLDPEQIGVARLPLGVGITGIVAADAQAGDQRSTSIATSASTGSAASTSPSSRRCAACR